jgi:DNA-binding NtrC family response regulator
LLNGQGWQVESLEDSNNLEAFLAGRKTLAVISETTLPGIDASDTLQICARQGIPLIFLGHDSPVQTAVDLIRQGAHDYLEKPFSRERLFDLLNQLPNRQNS